LVMKILMKEDYFLKKNIFNKNYLYILINKIKKVFEMFIICFLKIKIIVHLFI